MALQFLAFQARKRSLTLTRHFATKLKTKTYSLEIENENEKQDALAFFEFEEHEIEEMVEVEPTTEETSVAKRVPSYKKYQAPEMHPLGTFFGQNRTKKKERNTSFVSDFGSKQMASMTASLAE
jgi:hypothetical protein